MQTDVYVEREGELHKFNLDPSHFSIDASALDRDLCSAGRIMLEYGVLEAELRTEVARKEANLDHVVASLDSEIRLKAKQEDNKITEAAIKNRIILAQEYHDALESLRRSRQNHNTMRWAMNALNKKTDCLISMTYRERQLMKAEQY